MGFGGRGGFAGAPQMPQMSFGVHPQQQFAMAGPPMYAQPYGRGGYPPQMPQYGAPPPQGTR